MSSTISWVVFNTWQPILTGQPSSSYLSLLFFTVAYPPFPPTYDFFGVRNAFHADRLTDQA
jgi:hypothetical protein